MDSNLLAICLIAFVAVFILLSLLSVAMQLITSAFPERKAAVDQAVVAAIATTVAAIHPGARVTKIEEES